IYISPDAYVDRLCILSGADIQGNIISDWNSANYKEVPSRGYTELLFGAHYTDSTTLEKDSDFNLSYSGNIKSNSGINMRVLGGNLEFNGTADVKYVDIAAGATLSGTGKYILTSETHADGTVTRGTLSNMGTFDLGEGIKNIEITGSYFQDMNANLKVDFNSDAGSDKLVIREGSATLMGTITLTPQVDYYFNGQKITIDIVDGEITSNSINGNNVIFNNISPVLEFSLNTTDTTEELIRDGKYVIDVSRVEQGYQSVADDKISAGIGSAIDNEVNKPKEEQLIFTQAKKDLIFALDNPIVPTTITGNERDKYAQKAINTNLKKLNPNVVSSQAQAVVDTHATLNNLVAVTSLVNVGSLSANIPKARLGGGLGPAAQPTPKYNSWRNIVMPFSGYTDQHNGSQGYTNHNSGVIGAIERTFANGLTHGYHAALNHQSTSDSGSTVKGEGLYLGAQASYAPADWNGWSVFGSARLGVEQMRSHRNVYIPHAGGTYFGRVDSDWTGFSGSLNLGTALTKEHGVLISGPFAALDYSFVHRPGVTETGAAYRAHLDGATYDSLRTQLGYRLVTKPKPLDSYDSTQWQAHASVAWNHELLNDNGTTTYQLVEFPGKTIEDDVETYGRDSMSIAAGVIFKTPNRLDVGLTLGSDIYRKGGSSVYGKVNFEWKF
ncbi:MAG: autotransporter domain-containing protein, partial [Phascolarctobacterium sp.]